MKILISFIIFLFPLSALALSFDGTNDYVSLGTPTNLQFTNTQPFSGSLWIKVNPSSSGITYPVDYALNGGRGWYLAFDDTAAVTTNGMLFDYFDGGANKYTRVYTATSTLSKGFWHHVVFTRGSDNTTADNYLYIDGVDQTIRGNNGAPSSIDYTSLTARIGARGDGGYFNGLIDDVRVYNRVLTKAEIRTLFYGQAIRNGLVGYWPLIGATTGTFEPDFSGSKFHGTRTNGPYRSALSPFNRFRR